MKFYHRTTEKTAEAILKSGFKDGTGGYMMQGLTLTGVWVSDRALDVNEGARGEIVLEIQLRASGKELADREIKEDGKPYREWCLPAELLNTGKCRIVNKNIVQTVLEAAVGKGQIGAQVMASLWAWYFQKRWVRDPLHRGAPRIAAFEDLEQKYQEAERAFIRPIIQEIERAFKTGDAKYLHDFANAIEEGRHNMLGKDPVRTQIGLLKLSGGKPKTIEEIKRLLPGHTVSRRHLYRICEEIGYVYAAAKQGCPRGARRRKKTVTLPCG